MENLNNNIPNKNKKKKKKKRRLRKPIRIALYCMGALAVFLIACGLFNLIFGSNQSDTTLADTANTTSTSADSSEEAGTDDDSTDILGEDSIMTVYEDQGATISTVIIDAGHGGVDAGTVVYDEDTGEELYYEKDIALKVALLVREKIEATNPNIEVRMTREDDNWNLYQNEDLDYRVEEQTDTGADYFVSLHCNSIEGYPDLAGYNIWVKPLDTAAIGMANTIEDNFEKIGWSINNGMYYADLDPLQVVTFSPIHAMLIEMGYLTNPEELAGLTDDEQLDKIADAIAAAISDYIMNNPTAQDEESRALTTKDVSRANELGSSLQSRPEDYDSQTEEFVTNADSDSSDDADSASDIPLDPVQTN